MAPQSRLLALVGLLALAACTTAPDSSSALVAQSALTDAGGKAIGSAQIRQSNTGLMLNAQVSGLTPGQHGIHLHLIGKCEAPGFASAGGHLNPAARQHGTMNASGPHLGDLPNIDVGADGNGTISASIPGPSPEVLAAINDADGTAVVVHAGPDDYKTDPSGNSGGRIACGVLSMTTN
ncbi:superoxide dismutase family protein [Novosphingobium sp.]|uniref:superoxide dismutase family protein n=1 Tax=Novosphingobium sp. TaxID=1874826 RepID=UPI002625835D|nr:superoxide dismutase family protein [Novosphingobium sp.]